MKLGKKKENKKSDDFLAEIAREDAEQAAVYTQDIPEDEIWTYKIEGLQPPHIGIDYKNAKRKKIIVVIVLLIAIFFSIYLSVRALHKDEYTYNTLPDGTYELVKYTNPGEVTDAIVQYINGDEAMPVSVLHEYAFNCDEKIKTITIGAGVKQIDAKSFYSCWSLQTIFVDDDNPYYCDVDGVLYNKDMTEIIHYPEDHDAYLRTRYGYDNLLDDDGKSMTDLWKPTDRYNEEYFNRYNLEVRTYIVPSTVTKIGELAFAYSNITDLYLPEGVTDIESMGVFKNTVLKNIYSYKTDKSVFDTSFKALDSLKTVYYSLPEGLQYIGSDAFTYDKGLSYMYIPSSVKYIGHHAFWDTDYKEDGEVKGVSEMNIAASEADFATVQVFDNWLPKYDYKLFKKTVNINYNAARAEKS